MAGSGVGLNPRAFEQVLRQHGCEFVRSKGGHDIWKAPSGDMLVSPCGGRKGQVPIAAVKNAARSLGLSLRDLVGR